MSPITIPRHVAVIGGGAVGLVAARELRREGHKVVVFEKNDQIGGTWVYTPRVEPDLMSLEANRPIVHSSLYSSLRTNLPRETMGYQDYPFVSREGKDRDPRRFPGHKEVLMYLKDFAGEFRIEEMVRFETEVVNVKLEENGREWRVKSKKRGEVDDETFDAVVVCNGHFTEPRIAEIPGIKSWPGKQIHSHNYRIPEPFQDQNILLGTVKQVGSMLRNPYMFHNGLNLTLNFRGVQGAPVAPFASLRNSRHDKLQDAMTALIFQSYHVVILIGSSSSATDISMEIAGVAKEVHIASRSAADKTCEKLPGYDNMWLHSMIESAHEDGTVVFQDGSVIFADIILHCTGYKYDFPFLETNGIVTVDDNRVGPLYKHIFPPLLAPWLCFVGLSWKVIPFILFEFQCKWIARVLSGQIKLPSQEEMMEEITAFYSELEASGVPKRYTHNMADSQFEYNNWLASQCGCSGIEEWRKQIYYETAKRRQAQPESYRDEWEDQDLILQAHQDFLKYT